MANLFQVIDTGNLVEMVEMDDGTGRAIKCYPNCDDFSFESWVSSTRLPAMRVGMVGSMHSMHYTCQIIAKLFKLCGNSRRRDTLQQKYGMAGRDILDDRICIALDVHNFYTRKFLLPNHRGVYRAGRDMRKP